MSAVQIEPYPLSLYNVVGKTGNRRSLIGVFFVQGALEQSDAEQAAQQQ